MGVVVKGTKIDATGLGLGPRAGQIGHSIVNTLLLATFFRSCTAEELSRGDGPGTRHTLRLKKI